MDKLTEIVNMVKQIIEKSSIDTTYLYILLKITAIAMLAEFAVSICKDSGEAAISNKIELGAKIIILSMSIPIISKLGEIILQVLP